MKIAIFSPKRKSGGGSGGHTNCGWASKNNEGGVMVIRASIKSTRNNGSPEFIGRTNAVWKGLLQGLKDAGLEIKEVDNG